MRCPVIFRGKHLPRCLVPIFSDFASLKAHYIIFCWHRFLALSESLTGPLRILSTFYSNRPSLLADSESLSQGIPCKGMPPVDYGEVNMSSLDGCPVGSIVIFETLHLFAQKYGYRGGPFLFTTQVDSKPEAMKFVIYQGLRVTSLGSFHIAFPS